MKFTLGTSTVTLVDASISAWQPYPAKSRKTHLGSYVIPGGQVVHYPQALELGQVSVRARAVQADEATAWAVIESLFSLQSALAPVTVQFDDFNAGGPADGAYWLEDITPAYDGDYVDGGDIDIQLTMTPTTADLAAQIPLQIEHQDTVITAIEGGSVSVGTTV